MKRLLSLLLIAVAAQSLRAETLRPWTDYRVILWMGEKGQKKPT